MIATKKKHNDLFVKKVEPVTSALKYQLTTFSGFPQLPSEAVVVSETLVDQYDGEDLRAYQHQSTLGRGNGKLYCAYAIHDYDEDASGLHTEISVSEDNGATWTNIGLICPLMSDMDVHGTYPAQWAYPSLFLNLPSGFYILLAAVSGFSEFQTYVPLGTLVRKINSDNTFGELLWVHDGIDDNSRSPQASVSGYPSYNFAPDSLIEEVYTYITQDMFHPKILWGWESVWSTQEDYILDNTIKLREPTEITPYNYDKTVKCWKTFQDAYNYFQDRDDDSTQVRTNIPDANPTARRWINYSPEIILSLGNTAEGGRTELGLFVWRKDNRTGQYELSNGDAYSFSSIIKTDPVYPGFAKNGGEQLPFMLRYGKDQLEVAFSVSKEEIYYKRINVSVLI